MAEYRVEFTADSSAAERSIKALKKEIKGVTKEFEGAEIGAADFLEAASDLSGLQKELKDARSAVVDIDGAYKKLSQTMAQFRSGMGARGAIPSVASPIRGTAQQFGSPEYFDALNRNLEKAISEGRKVDAEIGRAADSRQQAIANFRSGMGAKGASWVASSVQGTPQQFGSPAYFDALNKSLKRAIDEGRQLDAEIKRAADSREQAITAFRSGMGARGAIPAIASPIRGGMEYGPAYGSAGSPAYLEEVAKAAKKAQQELDEAAKTAGTIAPPARAFQPLSLASYEAKLQVLKREARLISPSDVKWKELNKQILQAERGIGKINKMQKLGPTPGQRAGAAGGAFLYGGGMGGGVGSAVGGIAGGLAGGVPGAFVGAAIGQVADNLGTALAGITSQAAAVQKMQRGLAMASVDAKDFAEAQAAVGEMSQKLLMPLEQTTKYFAQLRANTKEYNLSVAETREILEGTALAIMATGGSAEDLEGAMRAVVQIMSKGGVQAEELRGQLGERFPGAVVKFAQANKMSFEELQAGLEGGQIGIREFINFAKKNYTDYAKFSEQLATAPEYAGQRLKLALEQLSLEVGSLFGPMGAGIQDALTSAIKGISDFVKENRVYIRQFISDFGSIVGPIAKIFVQLLGVVAKFSVEVGKVFQGLYSNIRQALGMANIGEAKARLDRAEAAIKGRTRPKGNTRGGDGGFTELDQARQAFRDLGGQAAFDKANAPSQPTNLTFGGPGAGMSIDRQKEDKEKKDSLEAFERLRDQLANAYNKAEIERIKAEYELRKRLQEDLYDMQEFGANRLQKQNIQFLRALAKAEQDRRDVAFSGQLDIAEAAGKVAPSASVLPSARSGAASSLTSFTSQQLIRATQDASRFNGIANMCSESVKAFYKSLGISLPGVTAWADTVRKAGQTMTDWSKLQAGDIVATGRPGDTPHVGVYTGGQNVFHQSRSRGLAAGNYPDLSYFKQQGYFVRPSAGIGAGAPRAKVGSNEIRDTMAGANTAIAEDNAALADRNAITVRAAEVLKALGRYMQEAYNVPDLTLDNQLLKERNDLIEQGINESAIDYRMRVRELELQYQDLLKRFPSFAKEANLSEAERTKTLADLKIGLDAATEAERNKNDETERGTYIRARAQIADELAMARSFTPDQELRTSITQRGFAGEEAETLFQEEKALQGAQKLKADMQGIAGAIGDAFGEAFKGIVTGSISAQEALEGVFQSIADYFMDMVAQMIAEFLKLQLIKGLASLFPGLGFANGGVAPGGFQAFASGGIAAGGFQAFANGGIVTGPTLGLVGEGRYNEAVIPLPDGKSVPVKLSGGSSSDNGPSGRMQSAMARYGTNARGESAQASNGNESDGGTLAPGGLATIDVRYSIERINDVEYVTASQFQEGMRQAAQQGAAQGEQRTLRRLQQSPSTRKRIGV
jgi:tape measure domain-containing protein